MLLAAGKAFLMNFSKGCRKSSVQADACAQEPAVPSKLGSLAERSKSPVTTIAGSGSCDRSTVEKDLAALCVTRNVSTGHIKLKRGPDQHLRTSLDGLISQ